MATTKNTDIVSTDGSLTLTGQGVSMYEKLNTFVKNVLIEGQHYGKVFGKATPCLFKGGAELLNKEAPLIPKYEIVLEKVDFETPFFAYAIKTTLYHNGMSVSEGFGACNSKEKKFASSNMDKYFNWNNVLKMAKKRSYVDATITAWGISGIFTQDMEDLEATPVEKEEKRASEGITLPPAPPTEKQNHNPFPGRPDNTNDQYAYFNALYFAQSKIQYMTAPERHEWNKQFIGKESSKDFTLYEWQKACETAMFQSQPLEFTITGEENNPESKKLLPHFEQKNGNNSGITNQQLTAIGKMCEIKGYEIKEDLSGWTVDQAGQAIQFLNDN